ncbi:TPA: hypothetical protein EYP75_02925 [Candidatus Bathyarchaeota archaeon]|nr:hypothetical protein [Candidatus Bathyarchaeota archaeon]
MRGKMLIIVCGLPGTGKSTLARHLSSDLGGRVLRTDLIRRELFKNASLEEVLKSDDPMQYDLERIFDKQEEIPEEYQQIIWKQKEMVYDELLRRVERLLEKGNNVILDGTFYKRKLRERIYFVAEKANVHAYLIECRCPEKVVEDRLIKRQRIINEISNVKKMQIYRTVKKAYETPVSDSVPIIIFDTFSEKIEVRNVKSKDRDLRRVLRSIERLIQKSS